MLSLKPITWDNFWNVIELKGSSEQTSYLPEVAVYMAQSYVNLSLEYSDQCLAIYDYDILIGFTKIVFVPKGVEPYQMVVDSYMIDAFLIDQTYQQKGYGAEAFALVLDNIKQRDLKSLDISLTCYEKNVVAKKMFESFGFKKFRVKDQNKQLFIYLKDR